jgi:hypothetical protein
MPDMDLPNTNIGFDGAYDQLEYCFGLVRDKLGEPKYERLLTMAREARARFAEGENKAGRFLLQDMLKILRHRNR